MKEIPSADFTPIGIEELSGKLDLSGIKADLYDLTIWVAKYRDSYTIAELKSKVNRLAGTSYQGNLDLLWDNLFY